MARSALVNVMVMAATKAGHSLSRDFLEVERLQVSRKGPGDFVTAADLRAEEIIRDELEKARPGYSFLMEESGGITGSDSSHRWIVDPLDGTTNFLHSVPLFSVSIALEVRDELTAGVVYNPLTEELFTVERGRGAWFNDRHRLRVSGREYLNESLIACGLPCLSKPDHVEFLGIQKNLMSCVAGLRSFGSAALNLAWLSAGRVDGYYETGLSPWDVAAGLLLVRESGGVVSEPHPNESIYETGCLIAGNARIHDELKRVVLAG